MEIDNILLTAVDVWYADGIDVVTDDISGGLRYWHVRCRMHGVAVCSQATVARNVARNFLPTLFGISRVHCAVVVVELPHKMIEACVQQICGPLCSAGLFAVSVRDYCRRCNGGAGVGPWHYQHAYVA
eukprot:6211908-Pleurochrysis_carterae.AAC.3